MAEYLIKDTTLTEICNAIREKDGSTGVIPVSEIASKIDAIKSCETINISGFGSDLVSYNSSTKILTIHITNVSELLCIGFAIEDTCQFNFSTMDSERTYGFLYDYDSGNRYRAYLDTTIESDGIKLNCDNMKFYNYLVNVDFSSVYIVGRAVVIR